MTALPTLFSALGDATRFAIVERLLAEGEMPVARLQRDFEISPPAVSRHLAVLRNAGIVQRKVYRQQRLYSIRPEALETIGAWTISHREFWEKSLLRLERALKQGATRK